MGLLEPWSLHHGITNLDTRRSFCERKECRPLVVRVPCKHVDVPGRRFRLIARIATALGQARIAKELGISLKAVETYHEAAPQTVLNNR